MSKLIVKSCSYLAILCIKGFYLFVRLFFFQLKHVSTSGHKDELVDFFSSKLELLS